VVRGDPGRLASSACWAALEDLAGQNDKDNYTQNQISLEEFFGPAALSMRDLGEDHATVQQRNSAIAEAARFASTDRQPALTNRGASAVSG